MPARTRSASSRAAHDRGAPAGRLTLTGRSPLPRGGIVSPRSASPSDATTWTSCAQCCTIRMSHVLVSGRRSASSAAVRRSHLGIRTSWSPAARCPASSVGSSSRRPSHGRPARSGARHRLAHGVGRPPPARRHRRQGPGLPGALRLPHRSRQQPPRTLRRRARDRSLPGQPHRHHRSTACSTPPRSSGRFLQHVLPDGFAKVRHYGLFSPSRNDLLAAARAELATPSASPSPLPPNDAPALPAPPPAPIPRCAVCKIGVLHIVETLSRWHPPP